MLSPDEPTRTVTDVACTACGCVCDDLVFTVHENRIATMHNACTLARPWFEAIDRFASAEAEIRGVPCSTDDAIAAAAEILGNSRAPLIYGLSRSSTPGQRAAVHLADRLGATVDTTASVCHGPSILAIQQAGESTCSLGEVRQRADLVIFWGANPVVSHPRHLERYSLEPSSEFLPNGRADRTLVVIDTKPTATGRLADLFLRVEEDRDFEMIWGLRQLVRGDALPADFDCGVPHGQLALLAERMTACRYGAVFFGLGLAQQPLGHLTVEALLRLVADLNRHTRFIARRMRIPGDVAGADSVLCWQTGFPFAVNLGRGYPRYNPGEFSANNLLERGEVDACLLVGSESLDEFSPAARESLCEIPVIVLDSTRWADRVLPSDSVRPTIRFSTSLYGVHAPGTAYRMDEIPIPLRPFLHSSLPTDEDVLRRMTDLLSDEPRFRSADCPPSS